MFENLLNRQEYDANAKTMSSEFFRNVYSYMFAALGISGAIAYMCGTPEFVMKYFITNGGLSGLFYLVVFAPVGLGLLIQMAYNRLSLPVLLLLFGGYSALMGLSLSTIFLVYDIASIYTTFLVTAGAFAGMAILGYTTKTDLTKFGSLLYMVFIGMFIATIVNIFMKSDTMDFVVSVLGVFVFTGLTAYQMQQLKHISNDPNLEGVERNKLALIGGLMLYILFINLFLSLLRLLGNRD
jgi:FtsH-binding integral membrane protein